MSELVTMCDEATHIVPFQSLHHSCHGPLHVRAITLPTKIFSLNAFDQIIWLGWRLHKVLSFQSYSCRYTYDSPWICIALLVNSKKEHKSSYIEASRYTCPWNIKQWPNVDNLSLKFISQLLYEERWSQIALATSSIALLSRHGFTSQTNHMMVDFKVLGNYLFGSMNVHTRV